MSDDVTAPSAMYDALIPFVPHAQNRVAAINAQVEALAAAGYTIVTTDDTPTEWGILFPDGYVIHRDNDPNQVDWMNEIEVRVLADGWDDHTVVRRRPAGPWEVAP